MVKRTLKKPSSLPGASIIMEASEIGHYGSKEQGVFLNLRPEGAVKAIAEKL